LFINSIDAKNVLSFGPDGQRLTNLAPLNLFIGRNGSGKSNAFKIINKIDCHHKLVNGTTLIKQGPKIYAPPIYIMKLDSEFICDRSPFYSDCGELVIRYSVNGENTDSEIRFEMDTLISGDVNLLGHATKLISSDWSDSEFEASLVMHERRNIHRFLSFSLSYIFQRELKVIGPGYLSEAHTRIPNSETVSDVRGGGVVCFNRNWWTDGMLRAAKLIHQIEIAQGKVVLIEEPELGLEPRAVRRLFNLLYWIAFSGNRAESDIYTVKIVEKEWRNWLEKKDSNRQSWEVVHEPKSSQFFISSHSPVVLRQVLGMGEYSKIFEFQANFIDTSYDPGNSRVRSFKPNQNLKQGQQTIEQESLCSDIRSIECSVTSILDELGVSGSDILQCNGVVWVEGPSDVIYISKWLEMYAREHDLRVFKKGDDFEFQMYGGAILDSICIEGERTSIDLSESEKIVKMFSFSRNAYIVIDSDSHKTEDGSIIDKSNFSKAKNYIKSELEELKSEKNKVGIWFSEGDTIFRTIEDYLDQKSLASVPLSGSKRRKAQRIVNSWSSEKSLKEFCPELTEEIKQLYDCISEWQPD
jgi:hypothetical protein